MSLQAHVLLFDAAPRLTQEVCSRLQDKGLPTMRVGLNGTALPASFAETDVAAIVLERPHALEQADAVAGLVDQLTADKITTVVWGLPDNFALPVSSLLECLSADVSIDEVVGRLTTLARYAPLVRRLEQEMDHLQRLGRQLNRYFGEIDQEMRLAGRLQRDFLPRHMPSVPPLTFASLYRPASWISGDLYDVFRLDERHVGMFVADAMGHGIAAGLMTMFLRRALIAKQIDGSTYRIVDPVEAMANLHECLVTQRLPNCQFVTAAYAIVDAQSLELRLARGGHPYALYVTADGAIRELESAGGLLGVPELTPDITELRLQLRPGEKVIFYTDGIEDVLLTGRREDTRQVEFTPLLRKWAPLSATGFIKALAEYLDSSAGSLHPADDVTALVLEVAS